MKLNYDKCKNCKYFIQHYGINYNHIHKIFCGHCSKQPDPNKIKFYSRKQPCPHFEQNRGQKTKSQKKNMLSLIEQLCVNTEYIKLFLNKNNQSQQISNLLIDKLNIPH